MNMRICILEVKNVSGERTEQLGDLLLKYLRNNIGYLHEHIERVVGDIENALVTTESLTF